MPGIGEYCGNARTILSKAGWYFFSVGKIPQFA